MIQKKRRNVIEERLREHIVKTDFWKSWWLDLLFIIDRLDSMAGVIINMFGVHVSDRLGGCEST